MKSVLYRGCPRVQARLGRVLCDREALLVENGEPIAFDIRPMEGVDFGFDRAVPGTASRSDQRGCEGARYSAHEPVSEKCGRFGSTAIVLLPFGPGTLR